MKVPDKPCTCASDSKATHLAGQCLQNDQVPYLTPRSSSSSAVACTSIFDTFLLFLAHRGMLSCCWKNSSSAELLLLPAVLQELQHCRWAIAARTQRFVSFICIDSCWQLDLGSPATLQTQQWPGGLLRA